MVKYILFILLIVGILFFSYAIYTYSKDNSSLNANAINEINNKNNNIQNTTNKADDSNTKTKDNSGAGSGPLGGSGSSSGGSGNSRGTNPTQNENIQLPSDINTTECGFYYEDYQVCAGICDEGKCISENRSCYCKK